MCFNEGDFSSNGDKVDIVVTKIGKNSAPLNISIHPLTIGQYQGLSGSTGCGLTFSENAAEGKTLSTNVGCKLKNKNNTLLEALAISPVTK